jgi:hypothetical protein
MNKGFQLLVFFVFMFLAKSSFGLQERAKQESPMLLKVEELPGTFRQVYKSWDNLSLQGKRDLLDDFFKKDKYWGYFFSTWGKYYFYTENKRVLRILKEAIQLAEEEFISEGVIMTSHEMSQGHWYRETFARNMRLLLDAYAYTQEPLVLNMIESQSDLWLKKNSRVPNNGFEIFPYSSKLRNSRSSEINVNQNLQMGLVFSKLYFLPESKFYQSKVMKDLALNEVNAAISLIRENGFIPLNQHALHVGDSNYAGLSTSILYELVQIWGDKKWLNLLIKSGIWLQNSFDEDRPWNAKTDGKDYHFEQFTAYNLFSRIPAFYAAGISSERAKSWMQFVKERFNHFDILDLVPRWDHLQTLPEDYYAVQKRDKSLKVLPPSIYAFVANQSLNINIVASQVSFFKIGTREFYEFKDCEFFEMKIDKKAKIMVKDAYQQESELQILDDWEGKKVRIQVQVYDLNHPIKNKQCI